MVFVEKRIVTGMAKRIETQDDIASGAQALRRQCAVMRAVHDAVGDPPVRIQAEGFEGLARIIVGQQLSVASARAIWERCQKKFQPFTPDRIARARQTTMKSVGLSAPKIKTMKAAAAAAREGTLPLDDFASMSEPDIHDAMTAVPGIGPWTADIYIMFSLGRADAFAVGDLALQIGAQYAFGHAERPKPDDLLAMAEAWRPWRGVAARMLWAYYAHVKAQKSSAVPV